MNLDDFAALMTAQLTRPPVPLQRQLDTLKRLKLVVPQAQAEAFLSAPAPYEREPYTALLTGLAQESSAQVLSLDAEVADASHMYRDLMARLQALTGGELSPENVQENGAGADWNGPSGIWRVSFTLHGHPYSYDAAFLGNWLDLDFFPFLNSVLEQEGFRRRFITVDDARIQGLLVFYRSPEWAGFFQAGTGLLVRDR